MPGCNKICHPIPYIHISDEKHKHIRASPPPISLTYGASVSIVRPTLSLYCWSCCMYICMYVSAAPAAADTPYAPPRLRLPHVHPQSLNACRCSEDGSFVPHMSESGLTYRYIRLLRMYLCIYVPGSSLHTGKQTLSWGLSRFWPIWFPNSTRILLVEQI